MSNPKSRRMLSVQSGFTLLELMMTLVIVGILAAIAIPSYRTYIIRNAENQAMAAMGQLQVDLDRWRATALTYRGFVPMNQDANGNVVYHYSDSPTDLHGTIVYVPTGSTAANHHYQIQLFDGADNTSSLNPVVAGADVDVAAARSWVMIATPNPNGVADSASTILSRSTGFRCKSVYGAPAGTITASTNTCNNPGQEVW